MQTNEKIRRIKRKLHEGEKMAEKLINRKRKYSNSSPHTIYIDIDNFNEYNKKYNKKSLRQYIDGAIKAAIENEQIWQEFYLKPVIREK